MTADSGGRGGAGGRGFAGDVGGDAVGGWNIKGGGAAGAAGGGRSGPGEEDMENCITRNAINITAAVRTKIGERSRKRRIHGGDAGTRRRSLSSPSSSSIASREETRIEEPWVGCRHAHAPLKELA